MADTCRRGHPWEGEGADVWTHPTGYRRRCRHCRRLGPVKARTGTTEVLGVLETHQGEWFTFYELEAMLPHLQPANIRRGTYRLIDAGLILRRKPPGGVTTPIKVSYPHDSYFD